MKKLLLISIIVSTLLMSCARTFTPYQAANRSGLKCGKHTLR